MLDIREQFVKLDFWPCSALDKKKEVVTVSPCGDSDFDALVQMYDTYEPKAAIQGLPPIDHNTRIEWIRSSLQTALNLKAELDGAIIAHGMLFTMPNPSVVEFNLFVHNQTQNRGIGLISAHMLFAAAKRLGYKKVWSFESRNNAPLLETPSFPATSSALRGPCLLTRDMISSSNSSSQSSKRTKTSGSVIAISCLD